MNNFPAQDDHAHIQANRLVARHGIKHAISQIETAIDLSLKERRYDEALSETQILIVLRHDKF